MLTTPRGFRFPENDEDPDIERDIGNLARDVDGQYITSTAALRPAAGKVGRKHRASDTGVVSLDIGSAWVGLTAIDNTTLDASGSGVLRVKDSGITATKLAPGLKPSAGAGSGDEALRALGTVAGTAAAGNDSRIVSGAVAGVENLRIVRGIVSSSGAILEGTGFTVAKTGTGQYTVTITSAFLDLPSVLISGTNAPGAAFGVTNSIFVGSFAVVIYASVTGAPSDANFCFLAVGPR